MPVIHGKEDFIGVMGMLELECFPEMSVKNVIAEGDFVVVESTGNKKSKEGKITNPSFCEVYLIKKGKLKELRTYIVDTSI
jgi:ketosteroid isomerase-like protein